MHDFAAQRPTRSSSRTVPSKPPPAEVENLRHARFVVSRKIREEFENGRDYYAMHGSAIRLPANEGHRPEGEELVWHNEVVAG